MNNKGKNELTPRQKAKKTLTCLVTGAVFVGSIYGAYSYNTDIDFKKEANRVLLKYVTGISLADLEDVRYSDIDINHKTYYVHENEERRILSLNETVEGYTCLGTYNSRNSQEEIFYVEYYDRNAKLVGYSALSYDNFEKSGRRNILNYTDDIRIIDEHSPEDVKAYIPDTSIDPVQSVKTLG